MAVERGYERQVATRAAPMGPMVSAESYGAGLAETVGRGAEQLHDREMRAYQIERQQRADSEASDFAARFAKAREEADKVSIDTRNSAAPGGAGHAEAMAGWWEKRSADLLAGISETRVLNAASQQIAEFGGRLNAAEYQFQEVSRVGKVVADRQQASEVGANRARQSHDPKSYGEELKLGYDAIAMLEGVPADVQEKLRRYHGETVTAGYLNGLNDTNPVAALAMIDAGAFNDVLSAQQLEKARNGAQIEIRAQKAAAASAASLGKSEAREEINGAQQREAAGVEIPDAERADLIRKARLYGLDNEVIALEIGQVRSVTNREFRNATTDQIATERDRLRALVSAGKASEVDQVRLDQLEKLLPQRRSEFASDTSGWAAGMGMPAPPIATGEPASYSRRMQWARSVATATKSTVKPLLPDEASGLKERLKSGSPKDRVDVVEELLGFGGGAGAALRQIDADQPLIIAARLAGIPDGGRAMRQALMGADAIKANPNIFDASAKLRAQDVFDEVAPTLRLMDAGFVAGVQETTTNIYAERMRQAGQTAWNEGVYRGALQTALGGYKAGGQFLGGVDRVNGAVVALPFGMARAEFERRTTIAKGADWAKAGNGAPVKADGSPYYSGELRALVPVAVSDGRYALMGPRGFVGRKGGGRYEFDVRKMGGR